MLCPSTFRPYPSSSLPHHRNPLQSKINAVVSRPRNPFLFPYPHSHLSFPAAQIMNNLSSLIMSKPPSPETLKQAEAWARKSAAVCGQEINHSTKKKGEQLDVCESTLAVALFNIASLREVCVFSFHGAPNNNDITCRWRMTVTRRGNCSQVA